MEWKHLPSGNNFHSYLSSVFKYLIFKMHNQTRFSLIVFQSSCLSPVSCLECFRIPNGLPLSDLFSSHRKFIINYLTYDDVLYRYSIIDYSIINKLSWFLILKRQTRISFFFLIFSILVCMQQCNFY